jgi:hypothetical protein
MSKGTIAHIVDFVKTTKKNWGKQKKMYLKAPESISELRAPKMHFSVRTPLSVSASVSASGCSHPSQVLSGTFFFVFPSFSLLF